MSKTFKEIREGFKESQRETNAKFKSGMKAGKEKRRLEKAEIKESWNEKKVEFSSVKPEIQTNSFKDIRDNYKRDTRNLKNEYKEQREADKVELAEKRANRPTGYERTRNILTQGFALWLAIPALLFIFIVGLFVVVGLWDWVIGLFS